MTEKTFLQVLLSGFDMVPGKKKSFKTPNNNVQNKTKNSVGITNLSVISGRWSLFSSYFDTVKYLF